MLQSTGSQSQTLQKHFEKNRFIVLQFYRSEIQHGFPWAKTEVSGSRRKNLPFSACRGHLYSLSYIPFLHFKQQQIKSSPDCISLTLLSVCFSSTFKDSRAHVIRLGPSRQFSEILHLRVTWLVTLIMCTTLIPFFSCNMINTQVQRLRAWLSFGIIELPTVSGLSTVKKSSHLDWVFFRLSRIRHGAGFFHFYIPVVAHAFYTLKHSICPPEIPLLRFMTQS